MNNIKLVIGGAFQNKLDFVLEEFNYVNEQVIDAQEFFESGIKSQSILYGFHDIMKGWLERGKNPEDLFELLMNTDSMEVIISDEVGRGVVPLEKEERYYREQTGRVLCDIAKRSQGVYRVYCGLATKIKG